jgi:hypothetical protein
MELLKDRDFVLLLSLSALASATALTALIAVILHLLQ